MSDVMLELIARLVRVRDALGPDVHEEAARRAMLAIGRTVKDEAERKARAKCPRPSAVVVRFPLGATRRE